MATVSARHFSGSARDALEVICTPGENGEYTLEDILLVMERLEEGYNFSPNYVFRKALFGVVSQGKVMLIDGATPLGTVSASAMIDPQKLIGETVANASGKEGRIKAVRVTEEGSLLLAIREN
jgi:hypothetical protein